MLSPSRIQRLGLLAKVAIVMLVYIVAAKLGLLFAIVQANTTAVWLPTGIAIGAMFVFGYSLWPAIFIGAFFANFTTPGTAPAAAIFIAAGNTLESLIAVYFVKKYTKNIRPFERIENVFIFSFWAGIVAPAVSATIGIVSLTLFHSFTGGNYLAAWATWWLGDLGGALIVAPVVIIWFRWFPIEWNFWMKNKLALSVLLGGIFIAFSYFAIHNNWIFIYLAFPLLVWTAFTFGQRVIATGVFAITEISLWGTLHGLGPFIIQSHGNVNNALLLLDAAMASTAVTMLAFAAVVEENRQGREALEREKAADEAALASVNDAVIVTNQRGEVVFINPRAEALLGMPRTTVLGKDFIETVQMQIEDGALVEHADRPITRVLQTGEKITNNPQARPEYFVRGDGSRFLVSYMAEPVVVDGMIVGAIEFFRDISKEREANAMKTDFIALASHQLRTPLSIIGLSSELLQGEGNLFIGEKKNEIDSYAHDIQVATKQMMEIVNDLLNISRLESQAVPIKREVINSEAVVNDILQSLKPKIKIKRLTAVAQVAPEAKEIVADRVLFSIIMQNLISNAVKYASHKGMVDVSVTKEDAWTVIAVSDVGRGIPREEQQRIFEKFFRASNAERSESEGTGLGLYITKAMVEELGGTISFVSEEGKGSTFIVRLPR